jgi:preprotein translocase subunit SecA
MQQEEMDYPQAQDFLFELVEQGFENDQHPRLEKLLRQIEDETQRVVSRQSSVAGDGSGAGSQTESRVRSLLETIDNTYPLSPASAARYVEAEGGTSSMMASGTDNMIAEVQEQLEGLYAEVEQTLGDIFIESNLQMPLTSLVDNRLPRSVYRQIEERLGLEGLEQVENTALGQLDPDTREIVKDAFVRWQESDLMLRVIDYLWTRHLTTMEGLRHSIGLQAYAQKDPLVQYKVKAYELFDELKAEIRQLVVLNVLLMGAKAEAARPRPQPPQPQRPAPGDGRTQAAHAGNGKAQGKHNGKPAGQQQRQGAPVAAGAAGKAKIGRNDPCFCGSGRKYKHCHGR